MQVQKTPAEMAFDKKNARRNTFRAGAKSKRQRVQILLRTCKGF